MKEMNLKAGNNRIEQFTTPRGETNKNLSFNL
jgi:hypothetical protein